MDMTKRSTLAGVALLAAAIAGAASAQTLERARLACLLDPIRDSPEVRQGPPGTQTISIRNSSFRALQPGLVTIKIATRRSGCCMTQTYMSKDAMVAKQSMIVGRTFRATYCKATIAERPGPGPR
jgi:hypothetical protein